MTLAQIVLKIIIKNSRKTIFKINIKNTAKIEKGKT